MKTRFPEFGTPQIVGDMLYCPDILQICTLTGSVKNETGDIVTPAVKVWDDVCPCRVDSNGNGKKIAIGGEVRVYAWHVVFAKRDMVDLGTQVRVLDGQTRAIKAEGDVIKSGSANMLPYSELFL